MPSNQLLDNLKANTRSLLIVGAFVVVLVSFLHQGSGAVGEREEPIPIRIAFYKLHSLKGSIEEAFRMSGFELKVDEKESPSPEHMFKRLRDGELDIAGEISPMQYAVNHSEYEFVPFLGLEYNGDAFYHSVLFVPDEATVGGKTFKDEPGIDNITYVRDLVSMDKDGRIAILDDEGSTSGWYYPRSYLTQNEIYAGNVTPQDTNTKIYTHVLRKSGNGCVAGFMADFRLESLARKAEAARAKPAADRVGEEVALAECATPLIIDRSDPIPNGVFVMSSEFQKRISPENLRTLRQLWKSVRNHPVDPAGKTLITGWRERVERDLDLVEYHRDYVEYTKALEDDRETLVTVTIVVFIIVLGGMALALRTLGGKEPA